MEMYFRSQFFAPTRLVDHFIYVSKFCRSIHERHNHQLANKPSSVVYNFSNEDVLLEHQTKQNCFNSYYLYYGRLSREKGLSTLLQAFFACPSIQLRIIGDGPLKAELEELCQLHGAPNIRFLGYKKGQELYNIVASAKYVIVPSEWYENNPMTIIESYTLSTPVIASCIGGITEIVKDHTTGFLVQPSSISDLIRVIREADSSSENDYLKMQKAAQDFANAHFDRETYYQQLMSIYSTLVS